MKFKKLLLPLLLFSLSIGVSSCNHDNSSPTSVAPQVNLHSTNLNYEIDIYETSFIVIDLSKTIVEKDVSNLTFTASPAITGVLTVRQVDGSNNITVFSNGDVGLYDVNVKAFVNNIESLSYTLKISVVDNAPAPTIKKNLEKITLQAPIFPHADYTSVSYTFNIDDYIDASSQVQFTLANNEADGITMSIDDTRNTTLSFTKFGDYEVQINAIFKEEVACTLKTNVTITSNVPNQLYNGDFEKGYDGWNLTEWDKLSYTIYDSEFDIWGNKISNSNKYLYGYTNENGKVDFTSSIFKLTGSRYITLKLAGNCTDELYISLMKYNENGEDVEIAKLNNWYYGKYAASGFIFRDYYYCAPEEYQDSECYFLIHDGEDANCQGGFGFINVDEIKTYYPSAPNVDEYYEASFKTEPHQVEYDMSDTSNNPFTTTNVPYQLPNGDFESGYDHWFMTTEDKQAYTIYNSKTDIWQNPVGATKNYLYGYTNERYTTTFHSDLFKVGGSGFITFKIAGNNTSDLQFRLKKYVENGEDIEIAKFNNTYFANGTKNHSGFIFHTYYYEIDLNLYKDALCYFEVYDAKMENFGFICLDDIVTYYETKPTIGEDWLKASYISEAE